MSQFVRLASGLDVSPVLLDLMRADHLWNANTTRQGYPGASRTGSIEVADRRQIKGA